MDVIGGNSFEKLLSEQSSLHFMKRLAHLNPDGTPRADVMNAPAQQFVLDTGNHMHAVRAAVMESRSLIQQVEIPPPHGWLTEMELNKDKYRQQSLDLFTIVAHSILDRVILLINVVCDFGIPPKECSFKAVKRAVARAGLGFTEELTGLRDTIAPIADARHLFAHRGQHREAGRFTQVARTKNIVKAWGTPREGVSFQDAEAVAELLQLMETDLQSIKAATIPVLNTLSGPFMQTLADRGGPDLPNKDEVVKAEAVIRYFEGGPKPDFMS